MDRVDEENRIKQSAYRDRIAGAIADGIESYLSGGFESAEVTDASGEEDFDDAIHSRAGERGLTVTQYLGFAEAEPATSSVSSFAPAAPVHADGGHVDGSRLLPDAAVGGAPSSVVEAILNDAGVLRSGQAGEPDAGEDRFLDGSQGLDFSSLGGDPQRDRAVVSEAFSPFESSGFDYAEFAAFIEGLGLRHFSPGEFLYLGAGNQSGACAGRNGPPPRSLWDNIRNTALMIDEIRNRLGYPVRIISGYRNPSYNSCVGGASGSLHMRFNALDWTCSNGTVAQWHAAATAVRGSRSQFAGGIGRYNSSRFIHIDTRGSNANWSGS